MCIRDSPATSEICSPNEKCAENIAGIASSAGRMENLFLMDSFSVVIEWFLLQTAGKLECFKYSTIAFISVDSMCGQEITMSVLPKYPEKE